MGYRQPTAIQEQAIPFILKGSDLIACAQTGTGKTAAYLLPILNQISQTNKSYTQALVLAPTRELAQQIDQQVEGLAYFTGISSIAVYGGGDGIIYEQQRRAMKEGVDIIIATPGRLIAHLNSGIVKLQQLKHLVLDEADRMLDMGFYDDIMRIISHLPEERQTLLFSATMPPKIRALTQKILKNPQTINIAISKPASGVLQQVYLIYDHQKILLIQQLLENKETPYTSVIIFASRKETVKALNKALKRIGIVSEAFHSDLEQEEREHILRSFKNKQLPVLIGTDVISRGIDVDGISLVINFDAPPDPEDYVHRIGRTARAETTGTAITLINERDQRKFRAIENLIGMEIVRVSLPAELGEPPPDLPITRSNSKKTNSKKKFWRKKKKSNDS